MSDLGPITARRCAGNEPFHDQNRELGFDLLDFWRWSASDLVSNATRGVLAEYLVAKAVGAGDGVRQEWAAYDLTTADGVRIEVKSAAYVQSWWQSKPSPIVFRTPKTRAWDAETGQTETQARRQADVYVFALLAHADQTTIDPLDLSQWRFHVLPTRALDERTRSQHSITLPSLRKLAGEPLVFADLGHAIKRAAILQKSGDRPTGD